MKKHLITALSLVFLLCLLLCFAACGDETKAQISESNDDPSINLPSPDEWCADNYKNTFKAYSNYVVASTADKKTLYCYFPHSNETAETVTQYDFAVSDIIFDSNSYGFINENGELYQNLHYLGYDEPSIYKIMDSVSCAVFDSDRGLALKKDGTLWGWEHFFDPKTIFGEQVLKIGTPFLISEDVIDISKDFTILKRDMKQYVLGWSTSNNSSIVSLYNPSASDVRTILDNKNYIKNDGSLWRREDKIADNVRQCVSYEEIYEEFTYLIIDNNNVLYKVTCDYWGGRDIKTTQIEENVLYIPEIVLTSSNPITWINTDYELWAQNDKGKNTKINDNVLFAQNVAGNFWYLTADGKLWKNDKVAIENVAIPEKTANKQDLSTPHVVLEYSLSSDNNVSPIKFADELSWNPENYENRYALSSHFIMTPMTDGRLRYANIDSVKTSDPSDIKLFDAGSDSALVALGKYNFYTLIHDNLYYHRYGSSQFHLYREGVKAIINIGENTFAFITADNELYIFNEDEPTASNRPVVSTCVLRGTNCKDFYYDHSTENGYMLTLDGDMVQIGNCLVISDDPSGSYNSIHLVGNIKEIVSKSYAINNKNQLIKIVNDQNSYSAQTVFDDVKQCAVYESSNETILTIVDTYGRLWRITNSSGKSTQIEQLSSDCKYIFMPYRNNPVIRYIDHNHTLWTICPSGKLIKTDEQVVYLMDNGDGYAYVKSDSSLWYSNVRSLLYGILVEQPKRITTYTGLPTNDTYKGFPPAAPDIPTQSDFPDKPTDDGDLAPWQIAYLDYLNSIGDKTTINNLRLVHIDCDGIPELFVSHSYSPNGEIICSYQDGKLITLELDRTYEAMYIPNSRLIYKRNQNLPYYNTNIYILTERGFFSVFEGQEKIVNQKDSTYSRFFLINGDESGEVSKGRFNSTIAEIYDLNKSKSLYELSTDEKSVDFDAICEQIINWTPSMSENKPNTPSVNNDPVPQEVYDAIEKGEIETAYSILYNIENRSQAQEELLSHFVFLPDSVTKGHTSEVHNYTFDEEGNIISDICKRDDGSVDEYYFNKDGTVRTMTFYSKGGYWEDYTNFFNESGKKVLGVYEREDGYKSIGRYTYDENENLVQAYVSWSNGRWRKTIRTYDEKGRMLTEVVQDFDRHYGNILSIEERSDVYTYDSNGRLLTHRYKINNGYWYQYTYTYDEKGRLTSQLYQPSSRKWYETFYSYDENDLPVYQCTFDHTGQCTNRRIHSYDEAGRLTYSWAGIDLRWKDIYTYDEYGNQLSYTDGSYPWIYSPPSDIYSYELYYFANSQTAKNLQGHAS